MVAPKCLSFARLVVVAACTPVVCLSLNADTTECQEMCTSVKVYLEDVLLSSLQTMSDVDTSSLSSLSAECREYVENIQNVSLYLDSMVQGVEGLPEDVYPSPSIISYNAEETLTCLDSIDTEIIGLQGRFNSLRDDEIPALQSVVSGIDCDLCACTSSGGDDPDNPSGGQCSCTCSDELADISAKIAAVKTSVDNIRSDLQEHKDKLEAIRQLLYDIKGLINQIKDHQKRIDDYLYDDLTEKLKELKELLEEMRDNVKEYYDDFKKVQMMALTNSVNEVRKLNEKKFNTLINMISNNIPFLRDFVTMVSNNLAGIQQGFYTNELLLTATTGQLERIASLIPSNINSRDYFINLNYSNAVFYLDNEGNSFSIADLDDTLNQSTNSFDWAEFAKLPWFTRMEYLMLKLAGIYDDSASNADASGQMSGKETLEQQEDDLKDRADSLSQAFDDCVDAGKDFIDSFKSFTQRGEAVNKLHLLSDFIGDEPLEVDVDGELVSTCHALLSLWWTVFFSYVLVVFCWRMFRFWFYFSLYMYRWIMGVVL